MLRCKDVADLASDYVSRDLPLRKRLQIWLHLSMCNICRRYVGQMRQAVEVLRRIGHEVAPPSKNDARAVFRSAQDQK